MADENESGPSALIDPNRIPVSIDELAQTADEYNRLENERAQVERREDYEKSLAQCESERVLAAAPDWSVWNGLSFVAFRDLALLCEINNENGLDELIRNGHQSLKAHDPERLLLSALVRGQLRAIRSGEELRPSYWYGKTKVDRDIWLDRDAMLKIFHDDPWSLDQMMIWHTTRDPQRVENAFKVDRASASLLFKKRPQIQIENAAREITQRCREGLIHTFHGRGKLNPDDWNDLQIEFTEGLLQCAGLSDAAFSPADSLLQFPPDKKFGNNQAGANHGGENAAPTEGITPRDDEDMRQLLGGFPVGEAIQKLAFHHPLVRAAQSNLSTFNRTKGQLDAFNGIFNCGYFFWPLHLTVGDLDGFFRPPVLHDQEISWGQLPPETEAAFAHISTCFASIVKAARTNIIKVVDMDNKPVHAAVWQRRDIVINLNTSDLYDGVDRRVPLRRNLYFVDADEQSLLDVVSPGSSEHEHRPRAVHRTSDVMAANPDAKCGAENQGDVCSVVHDEPQPGVPKVPARAVAPKRRHGKLLKGPAPTQKIAVKKTVRDWLRAEKFTIKQLLEGVRGGGPKQQDLAGQLGVARSYVMQLIEDVVEEEEFSAAFASYKAERSGEY
jgi:hypothetical protein